MQIQEYWTNVAALRQQISEATPEGGPVYIAAIKPPHRVTTCSIEAAARSIVDGTNRLATPAEISAYQAEHAALAQRLVQVERERNRQYVEVPPVLLEAVAEIHAFKAANAANAKAPRKGE